MTLAFALVTAVGCSSASPTTRPGADASAPDTATAETPSCTAADRAAVEALVIPTLWTATVSSSQCRTVEPITPFRAEVRVGRPVGSTCFAPLTISYVDGPAVVSHSCMAEIRSGAPDGPYATYVACPANVDGPRRGIALA